MTESFILDEKLFFIEASVFLLKKLFGKIVEAS